MRSSELGLRRAFWCAAHSIALCSALFTAACAPPQQPGSALAISPAPDADGSCVLAASPSATANDLIGAQRFRTSVEAGPLFSLAASSKVAACELRYDGGAISLDYRFHDGSSLLAKRDAAIEYTEQDARLASALQMEPFSILRPAERWAFGAGGCGIDWQHSEVLPASGAAGATELVYRGSSCNCQARVRKNASGQVIGLVLRSSC